MAAPIRWKKESEYENWTPPIKCRVFGHRFRETEYMIVLMGIFMVPLFVCKKCFCGRIQLHGRKNYKFFTPKSTEIQIRRAEMKGVEDHDETEETGDGEQFKVSRIKPDEEGNPIAFKEATLEEASKNLSENPTEGA